MPRDADVRASHSTRLARPAGAKGLVRTHMHGYRERHTRARCETTRAPDHMTLTLQVEG